jgi:hypothetical protein
MSNQNNSENSGGDEYRGKQFSKTADNKVYTALRLSVHAFDTERKDHSCSSFPVGKNFDVILAERERKSTRMKEQIRVSRACLNIYFLNEKEMLFYYFKIVYGFLCRTVGFVRNPFISNKPGNPVIVN